MKKLAQILILASALLAGLQLGLYMTKSKVDESSAAVESGE
ncbi:hypothetical protein [Dasania marina]|nr:hypothetical protein [Dasania marina]